MVYNLWTQLKLVDFFDDVTLLHLFLISYYSQKKKKKIGFILKKKKSYIENATNA